MKRGWFSAGHFGKFKRNRNDRRFVKRKAGTYYDVMGTAYKTKKAAASGNAFIRTMGL